MPIELPDRKYLLMQRDPLVDEYVKKWYQWRANCFDETLTEEEEQLGEKVREKWNARIYWPETTKQGVSDLWLVTSPVYLGVRDERDSARREEHVFINKEDGKITSLKYKGLVSCKPHEIPIIIDPTILTSKNALAVKKAVWEIVESEIGKQNKTIKGRNFAIPAEEPEALAAVFHCKAETFEKYLRWYDLKKAGLTFRLIGLIEFRSKPEEREQKFEEQIRRKEKFKNLGPIEGESTIRAGYNIIHRAIFRTPAPTQEDLILTSGKYNCLEHGESCSDYQDCAYREHWLADFNNRNKMPSLIARLSSRSESQDFPDDLVDEPSE
jgi:hypothetical protein